MRSRRSLSWQLQLPSMVTTDWKDGEFSLNELKTTSPSFHLSQQISIFVENEIKGEDDQHKQEIRKLLGHWIYEPDSLPLQIQTTWQRYLTLDGYGCLDSLAPSSDDHQLMHNSVIICAIGWSNYKSKEEPGTLT